MTWLTETERQRLMAWQLEDAQHAKARTDAQILEELAAWIRRRGPRPQLIEVNRGR